MKPILKLKIAVDVGMSAALLLLMAYGLVGEKFHEWTGIGMFALFVLHHILNYRWISAIGSGKYTIVRIIRTVFAGIIFLCMLGSMISGIVLSRYIFTFLPEHGGYVLAGRLHMICAYWGFVLMSLHLGFHWQMMISIAKKYTKPSSVRAWMLRGIAVLCAAYGLTAFVRRDIGTYLILKSHFVFFDYSESVIFFLIDYLAVMGLFVFIGYWIFRWINLLTKSRHKKI